MGQPRPCKVVLDLEVGGGESDDIANDGEGVGVVGGAGLRDDVQSDSLLGHEGGDARLEPVGEQERSDDFRRTLAIPDVGSDSWN